jgi:hypothetical protein
VAAVRQSNHVHREDGGGRQSIPSSSIPAAAGVIVTTPFPESGHIERC